MKKNDRFRGVITALCTPFHNGKVDFTSMESLIKDQLGQGVHGFVVNGTTGESPTLDADEVQEIFRFIKKRVPGDFPLILGTGSNSTAKTIKNGELAAELGADAVLVVVPYYNKPPQKGLVSHFTAIADKSKLPVILYNVPGRTIVSLQFESIKKLAEHPRIVGIKEASGDIPFAKKLCEEIDNFLFLSGDDGTYIDFLKVGGHGVISVSSHINGKEMVRWYSESQNNMSIDGRPWEGLFKLLAIEPNPIPVKMALFLRGVIQSPELRLPLVSMSDENTQLLKREMIKLGLING